MSTIPYDFDTPLARL